MSTRVSQLTLDEKEPLVHKALPATSGLNAFGATLDRLIFYALLLLIPLTAIPYGTVEPWWIALFECLVFLVAMPGVVHALFVGSPSRADLKLVAPLLALVFFVFLQSLRLFSAADSPKVALSADAYGSRRVAIMLFALVVFGFLLLRHTVTRNRIRSLHYVIIGVCLASALFGILNKGLHHDAGAQLAASRGFGQFVNRNHFAFLMEMALGLSLGQLVVAAGNRRRLALFLAIALLLWVALVLSNSRGGIFASLCQLLFLGVLLDPVRHLAQQKETGWGRVQNRLGGVALRAVLLVGLVTVFAYGVGWVGGESVVSNFQLADTAFSEQGTANRANTSRKQIWVATWEAIKANPVAGFGFGGYWIGIRKYHDASGEFSPQQAHNDYLELLASGGLIGFALVVWFAVIFVRRAAPGLRSADGFCRGATIGAFAGVFGVLVHSFLDFGLHITINALVLIGLLVIAVRCADDQQAGKLGTQAG
jgi:O-antigen ligase